jgi:hypothetical protein
MALQSQVPLKAQTTKQLLTAAGFRAGWEDAWAMRPADPAKLDDPNTRVSWAYERARLIVLDMRRMGINPPARIRPPGERRARFTPDFVSAWNAYWQTLRAKGEPQAFS